MKKSNDEMLIESIVKEAANFDFLIRHTWNAKNHDIKSFILELEKYLKGAGKDLDLDSENQLIEAVKTYTGLRMKKDLQKGLVIENREKF